MFWILVKCYVIKVGIMFKCILLYVFRYLFVIYLFNYGVDLCVL